MLYTSSVFQIVVWFLISSFLGVAFRISLCRHMHMPPRFPDSSPGLPPFHAPPTHRLCSPGPFTSRGQLGVHMHTCQQQLMRMTPMKFEELDGVSLWLDGSGCALLRTEGFVIVFVRYKIGVRRSASA